MDMFKLQTSLMSWFGFFMMALFVIEVLSRTLAQTLKEVRAAFKKEKENLN